MGYFIFYPAFLFYTNISGCFKWFKYLSSPGIVSKKRTDVHEWADVRCTALLGKSVLSVSPSPIHLQLQAGGHFVSPWVVAADADCIMCGRRNFLPNITIKVLFLLAECLVLALSLKNQLAAFIWINEIWMFKTLLEFMFSFYETNWWKF